MEFEFGIHKGDRVRVSAEGTVKRAAAGGDEYLVESDVLSADTWVHFTAVEKITPPLPTTPESVVMGIDDEGGRFAYTRTGDGLWGTPRTHCRYGDDLLLEDYESFEVIFDAGASS